MSKHTRGETLCIGIPITTPAAASAAKSTAKTVCISAITGIDDTDGEAASAASSPMAIFAW